MFNPDKPLVLHLEAASIPDLLDQIDAIRASFSDADVTASVDDEGDKPSAEVTATPKRGRGRPRKNPEPVAETAAPAEAQADPLAGLAQSVNTPGLADPLAGLTATAPAAAAAAAAAADPLGLIAPATPSAPPVAEALGNMTPQEAKDKAVAEMTARVQADPGALAVLMPEVQKMLAKYGVTNLKEVAPERGPELLADVKLALAGSPQV